MNASKPIRERHEAFLRGVPLEFRAEEVDIQFGKLDGKWGGSCKPNGQTPTITIDSVKWKYIDSLEREVLVYHELAHCLLMRGHVNDVFAFGECKSLLREHISACHVNWWNPKWREYYLDELFAPDMTTAPDWYNANIAFHNIRLAFTCAVNRI